MLIAGDLYDRPVPPAEAVELADDFLYGFVEQGIPVWVISGNHDSAERVAYGARMMRQAGVYVSRVFDGVLQRHTFVGRGKEQADIWLLPFLKPAAVRRFFPEQEIATTQQAVEAVLGEAKPSPGRFQILVLHQFVAGAKTCESEELSVGGSDQISAACLDAFDYVALGHLHGPQWVGREAVRYCGSPLKYSFSEALHRKSVTEVELLPGTEGRRAQVQIKTLPLHPARDLREIRGPIEELLKREVAEAGNREDYLHITLTDAGEVLDAAGRLRAVYPNLMRIDFARGERREPEAEQILLEEKQPMELFADFFEGQYGEALTKEQRGMADAAWRSGKQKEELS